MIIATEAIAGTDATNTSALIAIICIIAVVGTAGVFGRLLVKSLREADEKSRHLRNFESQLRQHKDRYAESLIHRLGNLASKRGQVMRSARRGEDVWLLFCPSYVAMLEIEAEQLLLLNVGDCRDVQLCTRETERRYTSSGIVQSGTRNALGGAVAGTILFGDAGMIAGSVIGAAGERNVSFNTVERRSVEYVVDLYTRLQDYPVVGVQFGADEQGAKEFYGIMAAAILSTA